MSNDNLLFKKKIECKNKNTIKCDITKEHPSKKKKQDKLKEQLNEEFVKNCTFSPQMIQSKKCKDKDKDKVEKIEKGVNFTQFIQKQQEFTKKVEEKINEKKEEKIQKEMKEKKIQFVASDVNYIIIDNQEFKENY